MGVAIGHVDQKLHDHFLDAQIYHLVRHDIAHGDRSDAINVGSASWSDRAIRDYCKHNKNGAGRNVFPSDTGPEQRGAAIKRGCDGAREKPYDEFPAIGFLGNSVGGTRRKTAAASVFQGASEVRERHAPAESDSRCS